MNREKYCGEVQNYKYIVANRIDGTGSRLIAILNAFVLADMLEKWAFCKVRFTWNQYRPYTKSSDKNNFRKEQDGEVQILGLCVDLKEEIFSKNFIQQYFIENITHISNNVLKLDSKKYKTFNDFVKEAQNYDCIESTLSNLPSFGMKFLNLNEYNKNMSLMWNKLEFCPKIQHIITKAQVDADKLKDFICIHIRSGDAIYDYADFRKYGIQSAYRATPCELALGIIQKNPDKTIVLVGDDLKSIDEIIKISKQNNVLSLNVFRSVNELSNLELFFYDVIFMSKAKMLYGTNSAVVRLANYIGNQIFINNYEVLKGEELYKILKDNFYKFNLHPSQKAFSLFHLYMISKQLSKSSEELISYLNEALKYDPENDKYRIYIINCLLIDSRFKEANDYIKEIFQTRIEIFLHTLFLKGWIGIIFAETFDNFFKSVLSSKNNYPYLNFIMSKIFYFQGNIYQSLVYANISKKLEPNNIIFQDFFVDIEKSYNEQALESQSFQEALLHQQKAIEYRNKWEFEKAIHCYKLSLNYSDDFLLEYFSYLIDVGCFDLIQELIKHYSLEVLHNKIQEDCNFQYLSSWIDFYQKLQNNSDYDQLNEILQNKLNKKFIDYLKNYTNCSSPTEEEQFVLTYIILKASKTNFLKFEDFDLIKFYKKIWTSNITRTQFILTILVNKFLEELKKHIDTCINMTSDIIALGHKNGTLQEGAKILREKLFSQLHTYTINKKPKVALCVWGIYRGNSNKTLELLRDNIAKPLKADVFIHTWDQWDVWNGYGGDVIWTRRFIDHKFRKFFPTEITKYATLAQFFPNTLKRLETPITKKLPKDDILSIMPTKILQIQTLEDFANSLHFNIEKLSYIPFPNFHPYAVAKMRYQIYQSYQLAKKYGKEHGSYDYIIMARMDQAYLGKIQVESLLKLEDNEMLCRTLGHGIDNRIVCAKTKTIEKFVNLYERMLDKQKVDFYGIEHQNSYYLNGDEGVDFLWCIEHNIRTLPINISIDIMLPTRGMIPNFYKELKKDLEQNAGIFADKQEYKTFLNFMKEDKEKLFKLYSPELVFTSLKQNLLGAKQRIKFHLSYKLGSAMIENSKSTSGYIKLPFVLIKIAKEHKKQEKLYQEKIKNNPNLKLPPLETCADYKEALKLKEHLSYKLGEAFIKASKAWYKGGYVKFVFSDVGRIRKEFREWKKK